MEFIEKANAEVGERALPPKGSDLVEKTADKCQRAFGQDTVMITYAKVNKKEVRALETVKIQEEAILAALYAQKDEPNSILFGSEATLCEVDAVQHGNWDAIVQLQKELPKRLAQNYGEREVAMAKQISEALAKGEKAVVAVGAMHVPKVLALLQADPGTSITPIPLKP